MHKHDLLIRQFKTQYFKRGKVYKSLPTNRPGKELLGRTSGYWRIEK